MEYLIPLWKHQEEAIRRATAPGQRDFALFFDMGTGKTATTINILRHRYFENKRIMRTLILCPVVVCENWRREFNAHSKIGHQVFVLKGSEKQRLALFNEKKELRSAPIFVTNYEALQMKGLMQALLNWKAEILVCDESQRLKNPKAVRTKMAIMLADLAKHRHILSGLPILNTPLDIWSQFRVLDKGESFLDHLGYPLNFWAFRNRYFYDKNAGMPVDRHFPKFLPVDGCLESLNKIIYKKAMRVMKSECLDLPPFIRIKIEVDLDPEQERLYESMKKHFIAYLKSGEAVTAQIAVTKALRLQQIVSGYCKTEDGKEITLKHNPRLDALESLLEDIPSTEKVIIWATFKENYRQIRNLCEKLGLTYVELHGDIDRKQHQKSIDSFQTDPSIRVMIANQGAGGIGVNLTAASVAIVYSRNFNADHDQQSEARNYRGGSEIHTKVTRYDLIAKNTIDEIIVESLANKLNIAEEILNLKDRL